MESVDHQNHLMVDTEMEACLEKQKPDTQQKINKASPDSDRLLEEPGSVLSDLRDKVVIFARQ